MNLPSFPRVKTNEELVIITYENGDQFVWGKEPTLEQAEKVAEELDIELKIFKYIEETIGAAIGKIKENTNQYRDDFLVDELVKEVLYMKTRKQL